MPIARFSLQSMNFIPELRARRSSFHGKVAYRVTVPSDLSWWYWLEFGTAGRQDSAAPVKTAHPGTYPIDPVNAEALYFPDAHAPNSPGGGRFAFHIDHPGIRPRLIYRGVRDDILLAAARGIGRGFIQEGVRLATLRTVLRDDVMPYAIEKMGEALDLAAPGVREDGRLDGNTAGEVWREEAEIEELD